MKFKNGITQKPMTYADFEMVSANEKRILLRYIGALWDDVYYEAIQMAYDTIDASKVSEDPIAMLSKIVMHIGFSIQLKAIRTYADLTVKTKAGKTITRRFNMVSTNEELMNILDYFFANGCKGIAPEFATHFACFYASWKQNQNQKTFLAKSY